MAFSSVDVCMAIYTSIIIYKIIVVHPSVHYGRSAETIRPRDTRCSISGYRRLEARAKQFLCMSVIALATDKNTNVLEGLQKKNKKILSQCFITEGVESELGFLPSQAL